jgi:hypothetical protein
LQLLLQTRAERLVAKQMLAGAQCGDRQAPRFA